MLEEEAASRDADDDLDDFLDEEEEDDDFDTEPPPLPEDYGDDAADMNDPSVVSLPDSPMIGGHGSTLAFGQSVPTTGSPSSPPLWAAAARQPDVQKLFVYKIDPTHGSAVSIGAIAAGATQDAFLRHFYMSMPKPGESTATFQLRPANAFSVEVGARTMFPVSPHHTTLGQLREEEKAMSAGVPSFMFGNGNGGDGGSAGVVAGELSAQIGAMQESFLETNNMHMQELREERDAERAAARDAERRSSDERIAQQQSLASTQQAMFDRLLATEKARSGETAQVQKQSSEFMLQLLTGMSASTRESMIADSQRREREEATRAEREREYFAKLHAEEQARRDREGAAVEARWQREREVSREDQGRREADAKSVLDTARLELLAREKQVTGDTDRRIQEFQAQMTTLATEREARDRRDREEREARDTRAKEEREEKARIEQQRFDREKAEERDRREREREREERREKGERDERDSRERREREDREAKDKREREEREHREVERKMAHDLAVKRMEEERLATQARQDSDQRIAREHAERLASIASADRQSAQTTEERRLSLEREDSAARERDRERVHKAEMDRLERQHQQAQAHETRMFDMQKLQAAGGGGLDRLGDMGKLLGVEPSDLMRKLFAPDEGVTDQMFKAVGALGEAWFRAQARGPSPTQQQPARQMLTIQTPEGPKQITAEAFHALQAQGRQTKLPGPTSPQLPVVRVPVPVPGLPPDEAPEPFVPSSAAAAVEPTGEVDGEPEVPAAHPDYLVAKEVNVLTRSREAKVSTKTTRNMRKLAKDLVNKLRDTPLDGWEDLLAGTLGTRFDFLEYLQTVSVWAAVADTGAPPDVCEQIVDFVRARERDMRDSLGRTEPLLPFNENDLVAFRLAQP